MNGDRVMPFSNPRTDRPRPLPKGRLMARLFSIVSVSAVVLAPVAAATLWLLISDPVAAAGVVEQGNLLPVFVALAKVVGKAIVAAMAAL
jgi:hypothetical protein